LGGHLLRGRALEWVEGGFRDIRGGRRSIGEDDVYVGGVEWNGEDDDDDLFSTEGFGGEMIAGTRSATRPNWGILFLLTQQYMYR
jgi:hypothetical protein